MSDKPELFIQNACMSDFIIIKKTFIKDIEEYYELLRKELMKYKPNEIIFKDIIDTNKIKDSLIKVDVLQFDFFTIKTPLGSFFEPFINLEKLDFSMCEYNLPLLNCLSILIHLRTLLFSNDFNQPLGDSLNNLTELRELIFGNSFNQLLGNSLNTLTELRKLYFGREFNQPLENSLNNLKKLTGLDLGKSINQPLGNSLSIFTKLIRLKLPIIYENNTQLLGTWPTTIEDIEFNRY